MSDTQKMFDSLVVNASDFMRRAAAELEEQPKHSVIDFYAGIELFLKARLLRDHWSLVIAKPEKANLSKFLSGDFVSVGLEDAIYRLRHVVNEPVSQGEQASFNTLREHRNKLVHFFHEKYTGVPDAPTIATVVSEQCKAWFYLHRLLTDQWSEDFAKHGKVIANLDSAFRRNRRYLTARWDALEPEIKAQAKKGATFLGCAFCGYDAAKVEAAKHGLYEMRCQVCESASARLRVKCRDCEEVIEADDVGEGECGNCGFKLDWDYLGKVVSLAEVDSPIAFCMCGYGLHKTVIPFDDEYLCLSCLESGRTLSDCEWCSEPHLGDLETSYITGCSQCDGHWDND